MHHLYLQYVVLYQNLSLYLHAQIHIYRTVWYCMCRGLNIVQTTKTNSPMV